MTQQPQRSRPSPEELRHRLATSVLSFRGYNVTNLGKSPQLLAHPRYAPIMQRWLDRGSALCCEVLGYAVDLAQRVRECRETSLATYGEAVALVVALELAQLEILQTEFDIDWRRCSFSFGYSLGEITAVIAGGCIEFEEALRRPLFFARDCVDLAEGSTLAVLFSRRAEISVPAVERLCQEINQAGRGVMGISAILSPNSLIVVGQGDTLERFSERLSSISSERLYLRRNEYAWPPLHTPILWQRNIVCRARDGMHTMQLSGQAPRPPVFSLVTGALAYHRGELRQLFGDWLDHPQQLWRAVEFSLQHGITDVIHVGPEPNIAPATFDRLAQNIESQMRLNRGYKTLSRIVRRPWLQRLLPRRASLLRAPSVRQVILEDWLLDGQPGLSSLATELNVESSLRAQTL